MRPWAGRVLVYGGLLALFGAAWRLHFVPASRQARLQCCQSSLRLLTTAAMSYATDWDDRLPPRVVKGDWMARQWTASPMQVGLRHWYHLQVAQPGPLWPYLKNACVNRCPSDPDNHRASYAAGAHPSYEWNTRLGGLPVAEAARQPLAWDRAPFHRGGRNVAHVPASPGQPPIAWQSEAAFGAGRTGR